MATSSNLIRSMTAFHRQDLKAFWGDLSCEIRSVNHRYLEPSFRLPDNLRALEPTFRDILRKNLARGKIDVSFRLQNAELANPAFKINHDLVNQLVGAAREIQQIIGNDNNNDNDRLNVSRLLQWPGVLITEEVDQNDVNSAAIKLFQDTLLGFVAAREREGAELKNIVEQRLEEIGRQVNVVREKLPEIIQRQKEKLRSRLSEFKTELDNDRVEQEIVFLAQKIDVDEELERLRTHVDEVSRVLNQGGPSGRQLDFLMQELNREANTLGSKSIDAKTSQASVELKVCIEQMREQIQNME